MEQTEKINTLSDSAFSEALVSYVRDQGKFLIEVTGGRKGDQVAMGARITPGGMTVADFLSELAASHRRDAYHPVFEVYEESWARAVWGVAETMPPVIGQMVLAASGYGNPLILDTLAVAAQKSLREAAEAMYGY